MDYPQKLIELADRAIDHFPNDIEEEVKELVREARKSKDVQEWEKELVLAAYRTLLHDRRHKRNVSFRRQQGLYGTPAKVAGVNETVSRLHREQSVYLYLVAGRTLGDILGSELPGLLEHAEQETRGWTFHTELYRRLIPLVPDDQRVKDAIPAARLQKIFNRAKREVYKREEEESNGQASNHPRRGKKPEGSGVLE